MVMSIKSKFEQKENTENSVQEPPEQRTKTLPSLSRQLSDPVKVKRTPAFRSDQKPFQRGNANATSYREKKTVLKVSDKPSNVNLLRKHFDSKDDLPKRRIIPKALNERSNSSAEIILNRCANHRDYVNITALYTEPIPKNQRPNAIHNMTTLKISDKSNKTEVLNVQNAHNSTAISDDINYKLEALSDTLKSALKKPLPSGPAPQKPPRTFMHQSSTTSPVTSQTNSPVMVNNARKDFAAKLNVNLQKSLTLKANNNHSRSNNTSITKPDPKYMLDKLENALKTNRIKKNARPVNSDDRRLQDLNAQTSRSKLNLNCLHSLNCTNNTYERLPDLNNGNSSNKRGDEPVYAEPFAFLRATHAEKPNQCDINNGNTSKTNRNSLYYMSTPIGSESTPLLNKAADTQFLDAARKTDVRYQPKTYNV